MLLLLLITATLLFLKNSVIVEYKADGFSVAVYQIELYISKKGKHVAVNDKTTSLRTRIRVANVHF